MAPERESIKGVILDFDFTANFVILDIIDSRDSIGLLVTKLKALVHT